MPTIRRVRSRYGYPEKAALGITLGYRSWMDE